MDETTAAAARRFSPSRFIIKRVGKDFLRIDRIQLSPISHFNIL
jgi:hypothetical protein